MLIVGENGSGKTYLSDQIAKAYNEKEVLRLRHPLHNYFGSFFFSDCTRQTQLIIVDEVPNVLSVMIWLLQVSNKFLKIEQPGSAPFLIDAPKLLLITNAYTDQSVLIHLWNDVTKYFDITVTNFKTEKA